MHSSESCCYYARENIEIHQQYAEWYLDIHRNDENFMLVAFSNCFGRRSCFMIRGSDSIRLDYQCDKFWDVMASRRLLVQRLIRRVLDTFQPRLW